MAKRRRSEGQTECLRVVSGAMMLTEATAEQPFGPHFDLAVVQRADRMEVWGTTEQATEGDYTEFRLFCDDRVIGMVKIPGY